jgi:superkiller protein 3
VALTCLHRLDEALTSLENALMIKRTCHYAWNYRGMVLAKLGRFDEALMCFDRSLKVKSKNANAWYGRACCFALQGNVEQAIENLNQAIEFSPYLCRVMANTDANFQRIRHDARFLALLEG